MMTFTVIENKDPKPPITRWKVVGFDEKTGWDAWEYPAGCVEVGVEHFIAQMEARGYEHIGFNLNGHQRQELQGQPKFKGVLGPMWDGHGVIRYETPKAYERLSV